MTAAARQAFSRRLRWGKWAGAYLGLLAAIADHQIVSNSVFARCPAASAAFTLTVGGVCAAIALLGATLSWRTRQALPETSTADATLRTDRFIATLSALLAFVCLLFILFATAAGLILRCERY